MNWSDRTPTLSGKAASISAERCGFFIMHDVRVGSDRERLSLGDCLLAYYLALRASLLVSLSSCTLCSKSMHFMVLYPAPVDPA